MAMNSSSGSEDDANTMLLGVLGDQAAARYGSDHEADYTSVDDARPQYEQNIKKIKDTIASGQYTGKGLDNLQSDLGDQQNRLDALMGPPASTTIDPTDLSQIIQLPTSPATKRNAIATGLDTPGVADALTRRISGIDQQANDAQAEIQKNSNMLQSILSGQQTTIQELGQNKAAIVREQQLQAEKKANSAAGFIQRAGIDIDQIDSAINTAATQQPGLYLQMNDLKKQIQAKSQVSFLDDPTTWLMNQFTVSDDVKKHNQLADQFNQNESFISSAPAAANTAINANAAKYTAMTNAEAQDLARQKELEAKGEQAKLQAEAVKQGISSTEAIQKIQQGATSQLSAAENRSLNQQDREDQRARQAQLDVENKTRKDILDSQNVELKDQRLARMKEQARSAEDQAARDDMVRRAFAGSGMNITTEKELNRLPPKQKATAMNIFTSYDGEAYSVLGASPVDVLSNMKGMNQSVGTGGAYENKEQKTLALVMKKFGDDFDAQAATIAPQAQKPEEKAAAKNAYIQTQFKQFQANPTVSGPTLPDGEKWKAFDTLPIGDIATRPSLAANKFAIETNILKSTIPQGTEVTPSMVISSLAAKAMDNKDVLNQSAKDISDFYKQAITYNNTVLKPDRFGLPIQETFNVPLPTGALGGNNKYNLASPKDAYAALIRTQMKSKVDESVAAGLSITTP